MTLLNDLKKFITNHHNEPDEYPGKEATIDDIKNFVITKDSDDNKKDDFNTPLISALIRTKNFNSALQLAAIEGVNLEAEDSRGSSVLEYAIQSNAPAALILALGGEIRASDEENDADGDWVIGLLEG